MENLNFVNRSREIFKWKNQKVGAQFIGKVTGYRERQVTDRSTGEIKMINDLLLTDQDKALWAMAVDTGLRIAISSADVMEGNFIRITKNEQKDLGNGQRVNSYTIEVAE